MWATLYSIHWLQVFPFLPTQHLTMRNHLAYSSGIGSQLHRAFIGALRQFCQYLLVAHLVGIHQQKVIVDMLARLEEA